MRIDIYSSTRCETFAAIFQHLKSFTEHINIVCNPERLFIQAMDASRIAVVEVILPKSWFDRYEVEKSVILGIHGVILFNILNTRDKTQVLNIEHTEDGDNLYVNFTSPTKTTFDKHFEMPLIDIDSELMEIPVSDYQATFEVPSGHFATLINQLKLFGDTLDIRCSEERIELISHALEKGKMSVDIAIDILTSFAINEGECVLLSFSLAIMQHMMQYHKLTRTIEINVSNNYPMKCAYYLTGEDEVADEKETERARMVFYLAPKIQDNEDD